MVDGSDLSGQRDVREGSSMRHGSLYHSAMDGDDMCVVLTPLAFHSPDSLENRVVHRGFSRVDVYMLLESPE